jgi:hypothetical protein
VSLRNFIETINAHGGLSYSNNYDIEWFFPVLTGQDGSAQSTSLNKVMQDFGMGLSGGSTTKVGDQEGFAGGLIPTTDVNKKGMILKYFCDEAQLPNVSAATGQTTGRFLGEGQVNYPHTRVFTDFQLGWICDADMTPLKFLNLWYGTIFQEYAAANDELIKPDLNSGLTLSSQKDKSAQGNKLQVERSVRLSYPDEYLANCTITKTEKGQNAPNSRASMTYTLLDVYPYSIDSVPLSYGTSQATKVTANFYYSKHTITYNNIQNYKG